MLLYTSSNKVLECQRMERKTLLTINSLLLISQVAVAPTLAAEEAFNQEFSVLADLSKATGDTGEETSAQRMLATWDAQYELSPRWSVAGNLKAFRGDNGEALTDNIQGISNIDAERFSKIYELYMQYQVSEQTRIKCGQVDANLEFAVIPVAGSFISPPLGITPTAIALPTYYDPALSCSAFYEPKRWQGYLPAVIISISRNNSWWWKDVLCKSLVSLCLDTGSIMVTGYSMTANNLSQSVAGMQIINIKSLMS
jgi:hypothetical protein